MSKIGVWNTAFLGDAVLTLPLLQTLRKAFPDAEIDFFVRKGFGELFSAHPAVTNVYEYDKRGTDRGLKRAFQLGHWLGSQRYSLWISAHASVRSSIIARWSSAKMRVGYDKPAANAWFYTHVVPREFFEYEEIERLLRLLLPLHLGDRNVSPSFWPEIVLPETAMTVASQYFTTLAGQRNIPVLGIHPGSVWGTKRWPAEYFAEIAARAADKGSYVLVFGGPGEEETVADEVVIRAKDIVQGKNGENIRNLAGKLPLTHLAAYISRLSCYVTNDSGPMHLAWAQRVPVTALFGPTVRDLGFFPRGNAATVMELQMDCRPCGLHGPQTCPLGHHRCMRDMTPDTVWADIDLKLFGKTQEGLK